MSTFDFDPLEATCSDWKKIDPDFKVKKPPLNSSKCGLCDKIASTRCSGCYKVVYCTTDHQRKHWKLEHSRKCCPFKVIIERKKMYRLRTT